jgi:hypothetical protein
VRIAVAALTEDGGHGVLAGLLLGVGELLEGGVDDGVKAFLETGKGLFHRALHGGRDEVVGYGGGQLLGDEGIGVELADIDAFAGPAAEELLLELHEHGDGTRADRGMSLSPAGALVEGLASFSGARGVTASGVGCSGRRWDGGRRKIACGGGGGAVLSRVSPGVTSKPVIRAWPAG